MLKAQAKYHLGQVVRHRKHPFRGVVFDIDPEFSNTDEWYSAIPEDSRPKKDQPFYHLLADRRSGSLRPLLDLAAPRQRPCALHGLIFF